MFRSILALSLVLLTGSLLGAAAQSPGEGVILVPLGRAQSVPFKSLGGASVGNILVAHILHVRPDEVTVRGAVAGETWLELVGRDGRRKRFSVRVTASAQAEACKQAEVCTPADAPSPKPAADTPPAEVAAHSPSAAAGLAAAPSAPAKPPASVEPPATVEPPAAAAPRRAAPAPQPVEVPRASRSFWSRFEVSFHPEFIFDKEVVPLVSDEVAEPGKLQEIVRADSREKLATSSQREQTMTVRRSAFVMPVNFRYPLGARNSLSVELPFISREDEVKAGDNTVKTRGRGLGDVQVKLEREQPRLWKTAWDGTLSLSVGLPTGKSIYNVRENQTPLGSGHYEVGVLAGVGRIFDPFVFNAAGGFIQTLPRTVHGTRIAPGPGYVAQTSIGVAVSDRWIFSEELNFTRRPNVLLSTPTDARTENTDQAYLKHGLIFKPSAGQTLQMLFGLGVNSASADHTIAFRWVYGGGGRGR